MEQLKTLQVTVDEEALLQKKRQTERSVERDTMLKSFLSPLGPLLERTDITEIAINEPKTAFVETKSGWECVKVPELSYEHLIRLGTTAAKYAGENVSFDSSHPVLSCDLPGGERAQFVMPPACKDGTVSVTIRKIANGVISLDDYEKSGFFDKIKKPDDVNPEETELLDLYSKIHVGSVADQIKTRRSFLERAVELRKTVVIAGETGSGKTTFMKALMQAIPTSERIITIEDVPELLYGLPSHKNLVNLFYPSEATDQSSVTAASLMRSCLRMKPDRILLAELRGGETFDFLNVCLSGHGGSITSCHAGSCEQVFDYLALKVLQSPTGRQLPIDVIQSLLHQVIDVVVHVHRDRTIGRHITDIWYKAAKK